LTSNQRHVASSKREKGRDSGSLYDPNDIMAGYDKANAMIDSRWQTTESSDHFRFAASWATIQR